MRPLKPPPAPVPARSSGAGHGPSRSRPPRNPLGNPLIDSLRLALQPITPLQRYQIQRLEHRLRQEQAIQASIDALFEVARSAAVMPTAALLAELCPQSSEKARDWALAELKGEPAPVLYGLDDTTLATICQEIRERSHAVRNAEELGALMPDTAAHFQGEFSDHDPLDLGWALWMVASSLRQETRRTPTTQPSTVDDFLERIALSDELKKIRETGQRPEATPEQLATGIAQDFKTLLNSQNRSREARSVVERFREMAPRLQAAAQPDPAALQPLQRSLRDTRAEIRQGLQDLEQAIEQRSRD